jgi:hypothetical protein
MRSRGLNAERSMAPSVRPESLREEGRDDNRHSPVPAIDEETAYRTAVLSVRRDFLRNRPDSGGRFLRVA